MDLQLYIRQRSIPVTESGCWLWEQGCERAGYGEVGIRQSPERTAHRLSWLAFKGPIPQGLGVLHSCDVTGCVNPDHLFLGTQNDNMKDMARKGRRKGIAVSDERRARISATLKGRPDRKSVV